MTTQETYDFKKQLSYKAEIKAFFHKPSFTFTYVIADPGTKKCAIIDSALDYDMVSGALSYASADEVAMYVTEKGYQVEWILETHLHADHLSAAMYLKAKFGGKVAIGNHIADIQDTYQEVFNVPEEELVNARSKFDMLWSDFDTFVIGNIPAFALYVPGHTPADVAYGIGDALFVGDTLFMPDFGSARCDFPRGSADAMYDSVQKIFTLPNEMRMFMCHDYLPEGGRTEYLFETTIAEQKKSNLHLKEGTSKEQFKDMRETRDKKLPLPKMIIPSLQVNVRAGSMPENNGKPAIVFPVNSPFAEYPKE